MVVDLDPATSLSMRLSLRALTEDWGVRMKREVLEVEAEVGQLLCQIRTTATAQSH